jgi:calcineurin-like phosphoesterase family protein
MNVWFTSDLHLGHALAAKARGYTSIEDHDMDIITTLKSYIKTPRNILWILGDVAMKADSLNMLNSVGQRQVSHKGTCRKILVRGNHDKFKLATYLQYFEEIYGFLKYKNMWLSHCPMHPQELYGKVNVHGHIHKNTNSPLLNMPYLNVNWDFWRKPVSFDEIRETIRNFN